MKWQLIIPLIFLYSLNLQTNAIAHGVKIEHQITSAIKINAAYDTGTPLTNASVTVYAPNNPTQPWLKGKTDNQGSFIFSPDSSQSGSWEIKVRKTGHGGLVSIPFQVDESKNYAHNITNTNNYLAGTSNNYNPLQKGLMIGCVFWGFMGTALFFWRFRTSEHPQEDH